MTVSWRSFTDYISILCPASAKDQGALNNSPSPLSQSVSCGMSIVTIRDVTFLNNPARFSDEYNFRVTFECISPLKDDLEWKLIFVSSPDSEQYDQELDDCMVGPVPVGINSFTFSSPPPDPSLIPPADVLGVAAIILTASYRDQEFVRVGYYQNTEYDSEELKQAAREAQEKGITNSPIYWDRLVRELADKPRVTRFTIKWYHAPLPLRSIFFSHPTDAPKSSSVGTRKSLQHLLPFLAHNSHHRLRVLNPHLHPHISTAILPILHQQDSLYLLRVLCLLHSHDDASNFNNRFGLSLFGCRTCDGVQ